MVTNTDDRFETNLDQPVRAHQPRAIGWYTLKEAPSPEEARDSCTSTGSSACWWCATASSLRGLITVKGHPHRASIRMRRRTSRQAGVGAAVGVGEGTEERLAALVEAGVDVIVVDTAHGIRRACSSGCAGSSAMPLRRGDRRQHRHRRRREGARPITGADAVKVGIGPGSICTTQSSSPASASAGHAIQNVALALEKAGVPVIGDGGVRFSGDVAKAIAAWRS